MVEISLFGDTIGEEEKENVVEAVEKGWLSGKGPFVTEFEDSFSSFVGAEGGVATASGTTALHLALEVLGIGEGDEVIVPAVTFAGSIEAVTYTGATPVIADIHPEYLGMDPRDTKEKITENTEAIMPVHLYGHPCDMDPLMDLAEDHDLSVVEDAAEAQGAKYKGTPVGSIGDVGCFSFYASKIITTGEGGMCTSNDQELLEKIKHLRTHADKGEFDHTEVGYSYNMSNLQGAVGAAQTEKLAGFIENQRRSAKKYHKLLKDVPGIRTFPEKSWAESAYWVFPFTVDEEEYGMGKAELREFLEDANIQTRDLFPPLNTLKPYRQYGQGSYPVSKRVAENGFYVPNTPDMTDEEVEYVADRIRRGARK